MRSRGEMVVSDEEYVEAVEEGVRLNFLTSPTRILNDNWQVTGLQCVRMELGEPTLTGRGRPAAIPGSEFSVEADTVVVAVGQAPDLSFLPRDSELERTRWETLSVDSNRLSTNVPGVFAGGDFVRGPGLVIDAIAEGRRAAMAIDKSLRGDDSRVEMHDIRKAEPPPESAGKAEESYETQPRVLMPKLSLEERSGSFEEIERGLSEEVAQQEARRCLRCDLET
jgi:NADPH-dependent glutamate synthase beta subunit-like oxidoreductase